jgi:hypothetical protein
MTDERIPLWRRIFGRSRPGDTSVFISGDASGSVFRDIETDADVFIEGDKAGAVFRDIAHKTRQTEDQRHDG